MLSLAIHPLKDRFVSQERKMSASDMPVLGSDPAGVISMSLEAGLEVEKSRLQHQFDIEVIREFGRILKEKTVLTSECGLKGFADPDYVVPFHHLYTSEKGEQKVTIDKIHTFLAKIADDFLTFDDDVGSHRKVYLVEICAMLHHFLSDELRSHEELGHHGWWN